MIEFTVHGSSQIFEGLSAQIPMLERALGGEIQISYAGGLNDVVTFDGHSYLISSPVRMGTLLDNIMGMLFVSAPKWRQMNDVDLGLYKLFPRDMCLKENDNTVSLTEKERDILLCVFYQPDHQIDRDTLLQEVWGYGEGIETHTLETHIYRLRQKVEADPSVPLWLVTTEDGYKLNL